MSSSPALWPRSIDFVGCAVPKMAFGDELLNARSHLSDLRSADNFARTIREAEFTECPPAESGLFLTEDDVEYIESGR